MARHVRTIEILSEASGIYFAICLRKKWSFAKIRLRKFSYSSVIETRKLRTNRVSSNCESENLFLVSNLKIL